jgi:two-component system, cell cycle sensor histidine kinase and response regulator CckA
VKVSESEQAQTDMPGGTETLLLAEDDAHVLDVAGEILRTFGYTVVEAKDGGDAIRKYRELSDSIDLLLFDVVMPGMNGKEAYDEIRKINPLIPVIFMSGYTGDVVLDKGVEDTTIDYISKPLSAPELLKKIRDVLER